MCIAMYKTNKKILEELFNKALSITNPKCKALIVSDMVLNSSPEEKKTVKL